MINKSKKIIFQTLFKLFGNIIKIVIFVIISLGIIYVISRFTDIPMKNIMEVSGIIIMAIGALSVMGGKSMTRNVNYNLTKYAMQHEHSTWNDIKDTFDSYSFSIIMGCIGLILLILPIFM